MYVTLIPSNSGEESHKKEEIPRKDRGRLSTSQAPSQNDAENTKSLPFCKWQNVKISVWQM